MVNFLARAFIDTVRYRTGHRTTLPTTIASQYGRRNKSRADTGTRTISKSRIGIREALVADQPRAGSQPQALGRPRATHVQPCR